MHGETMSVRRGPVSRLGGVPTVLPDPPADLEGPEGQLSLLPTEPGPPRAWTEVLPGVVHVPDWLDAAAQQASSQEFRRWAVPPAGLRHPGCPPAT